MSYILRLFRLTKEAPIPFDFSKNRYKAKKQWPPDFAELSEKEQFRFERKFRRRNKLAWARPGWTKATKLVQWGLIGGVTLYSLLFYDWERKEGDPEPFQEFRNWYKRIADTIWTYSTHSLSSADAQRLRERRPPQGPSHT